MSLITSVQTNDNTKITGNTQLTSGNVSISVNSLLSVTTSDDAIINFTSCKTGNVIYSNHTNGNSQNACPGFVADEIIVRNDGNVDANVTINFSNRGEAHNGTFIDATSNDSWIAYKITNSSSALGYSGGCRGAYQENFTNITTTNDYVACDYLQGHMSENSIEFDVAIYIPSSTTAGGDEIVVTFTANNRI